MRRKFDVLAGHCERIGRDPAEITRTVFAVDTADLSAFAASARALAAAGADGIIVAGVTDPATMGPLGQVLAEVLRPAAWPWAAVPVRSRPRRRTAAPSRTGQSAAGASQARAGGGQRGDAGAQRRLDHRGEQRRVVGGRRSTTARASSSVAMPANSAGSAPPSSQ